MHTDPISRSPSTEPQRARFEGPLRPEMARRLTDALRGDDPAAAPVIVDLRRAPADDGLALGVLLNVHRRLCGERTRSDARTGRDALTTRLRLLFASDRRPPRPPHEARTRCS